MKKLLTQVIRSKEITVLILIIILILILSFGSDVFLNITNFESMQASIAPNAIIAVGMMILLISGVFDLSVGSVMGVTGAIVSLLMAAGLGVIPSIVAGLCVGLGFGFFNGFLVAFGGVNPLIATIGTLYIGRGLMRAIMRGELRHGIPIKHESFLILGQGKTFGVYNMFWIMLVIIILAQFLIVRTYRGRQLFYVGGNYEASRLVGIKVKRVRMLTFGLSGLLAAVAGILSTSRFGISSLYLGVNVHLQVIISCLIGGASISGGQGSIIGALLGVIFLTLIVSAFNILEIGMSWQNIIVGIILIFIVSVDAYLVTRRRRTLGEI
ncbi:MAG TPA: ABC transporter permease [Spirochaetes bacterium]|nr:ABC transporter permease [Spirochaetota bacterium]